MSRTVTNSVENVQNAGLFNGKPAVLVILHPSPSANVIQTVDQVNAMLPRLRAALPPSIQLGGGAGSLAIHPRRAE